MAKLGEKMVVLTSSIPGGSASVLGPRKAGAELAVGRRRGVGWLDDHKLCNSEDSHRGSILARSCCEDLDRGQACGGWKFGLLTNPLLDLSKLFFLWRSSLGKQRTTNKQEAKRLMWQQFNLAKPVKMVRRSVNTRFFASFVLTDEVSGGVCGNQPTDNHRQHSSCEGARTLLRTGGDMRPFKPEVRASLL